jgi:hypothetical protein
MPDPYIYPDGASSGGFPTGRTGSFSFSCAFTIKNPYPVFTDANAPAMGSNSGGPLLFFSGGFFFQGLTINFYAQRSFGSAAADTRGGIGGYYGARNNNDVFDFRDDSNPYETRRLADISGTISVTIDRWEEFKSISYIPGANTHSADQLEYQIYIPGTANYAVDVNIPYPYASGTGAASNHKTFSGRASNFYGSGYTNAKDVKASLLDIIVGASSALPGGGVTITGITFEDGNGLSTAYSGAYGGGVLSVSEHAVSFSGAGTAEIQCWPKTSVTIDGLVTKQFDANFGSDVTLHSSLTNRGTVTAPGGVWAESVNCAMQRINLNGAIVVDIPGSNVYSASIDDAWGSANGVPCRQLSEQYDGYLSIYDDACWTATTITHAKEVALDSFADVTAWSGAGVAISSTDSGMRLVASSSGRAAQKTYDLDVRNYRYFPVSLTCDNASIGQAFVFVIGGRKYTVKPTANGPLDYDIDLMAPDVLSTSNSIVTDTTDSAWCPQGMIAGCEKVGTISITMPKATTDCTIGPLKVVRKSLTAPGWVWPEQMPGAYYAESYHTDGNPGSDIWRFARAKLMGAIIDGKPCCDLYYAQRDSALFGGTQTNIDYYRHYNGVNVAYNSGSYTRERMSMNNWLMEINSSRQLGMHATAPIGEKISRGVGSTANYYGGKLYADYLTLDSPGTRVGWGQDFASLPVNAWPCYSSVKVYPGFVGGYTLRFTKRVWGSVIGTVIADSPAGKKVTVTSSLGPAEICTTDANGFFRSAPRATKDISQTVTMGAAIVTRRALDATYVWSGFVFRDVVSGSPFSPFLYQHAFGQLYRLAVVNGTVNLWRSDFSTPPWALTAVNASGGTVDTDPALTIDHQTDRAFVVFGRSGAAMEIYSDDQGATWSMPVTIISGGARPTIATGHDGTIIRAALVGTVIKCTIQRPGDPSPSAAATWVDAAGVALSLQDDRFHLAQEYSGGERWIATMMITGDTAPSEWWSADPDAAFTSGNMSWTKL